MKNNLISIIIALIHFIITFFTDKLIINFDKFNIINYIGCKILLLIILFFTYRFLIKIFIEKDTESKKYFKHFLICFIPLFIIFLFVYPGIWFGSDVFNFFSFTTGVDFLYYLHYLSSVFYSIGLMIFPVPSGAILLQVIMFCIVISYITKNTFELFNNKKICYLIYLPLFLMHTLFYVYFANRPIMFGIAYLFLISILVFDYLFKNKLTTKKLIILIVLNGVVANWRSESIYLVLALPLLVFIVYKESINLKNILKIGLSFLSVFILVSIPQRLDGKSLSRNLPMVVNPLSYMLTQDLKGENLEENLAKINKVLDIEIMKKNASYIETYAIWKDGGCIKEFTEEEYKEFLNAYIDIVKNNFPIFIKTKLLTFVNASGIYIDNFTSKNLYSNENDRVLDRKDTKTIFGYKTRKFVVSILEGKAYNSDIPCRPYCLTNNFLIPIIIIGLLFVTSIFKKDLFLFLICGMLLGHTFILFITAPASYFMYYFNVFLTGWFIGMIYLIKMIVEFKNKKPKLS